ncbi:30S ribosomal protein S8 [Patescibacteria group bacterium]|nr:30S ribosomal protein S8 [Patescibacteria group bacterium]
MITDPIADLLTRIRNAVKAKHDKTVAPYSKLKVSVLEVLKNKKFISDFKVEKNGNMSEIVIALNTELNQLNLKRVSKPGQRIYLKNNQIKPVLNGYGISVISTPKGVMTGDEARRNGMGGELICEAW